MKGHESNRKSAVSRFLSIGIIAAILISGYSLIRVMTLTPGEKTTIVPGVTVEKSKRGVEDTYVNANKEFIVVYNDGTTRNLGVFEGKPGLNGSIDNVDVDKAVKTYCAGGRCDAKTPAPEVVLASVLSACGGQCRGADGKNAPSVTPEQVYAQVVAYCGDGKCKGADGLTGAPGLNGVNGLNGADGRTQQLACVIVKENSVDTRYYSAKYTDEPNSAYLTWAYRSRLPQWFSPNDCIDMRA